MEPVKRLLIDYRGERTELVAGAGGSEGELQDIRDLMRTEYQHRGYISTQLSSFEDEYEAESTYFGTYANGALVAAARLIDAQRLPTESLYYSFESPAPLKTCRRDLLREVSRLTAVRRPGDNPFPRHVISTTMISALIDYGFMLGLCGGVSTIKASFLKLFERLDLPALHEIENARLLYPRDELLSGFFYDQTDPPVPIYYLHDEAKAIFDGLFRNLIRTGTTLLGEPLRIVSYEVLL